MHVVNLGKQWSSLANETKAFRYQIHSSSNNGSAFAYPTTITSQVLIITYVDYDTSKTLEYSLFGQIFLSFYHHVQNLQTGQVGLQATTKTEFINKERKHPFYYIGRKARKPTL